MTSNNKKELLFVRLSILATSALFIGLYGFLIQSGIKAFHTGDIAMLVATIIFAIAMFFVAYGNMLYQICLGGHYQRRHTHVPVARDVLETMYNRPAPSLSVLIPSYKEERSVIWQTMISAALAEYPKKNVVLLIDDPIPAKVLEDIVKLEKTRAIPQELQALFDVPHARYSAELAAFRERLENGSIFSGIELNRLSLYYDEVAQWLEALAGDFAEGKEIALLPYAERFFINAVVLAPALRHRELAQQMRSKIAEGEAVSQDYLERHYARLAGLFNIRFSSFERKKYINLSHEANKAMNLNSYITLMGRSWREIEGKNGITLQECSSAEADFTIEGSDYVDTIDADSLMFSDYALRLIHLMEQPGNEKLAVVQSPCSSFPGCPNLLERIAGACIDVQFLTHQGYTHWDASFWVGANAMLRRKALEEIKEVRHENGKTVTIYIQDRTVIEDTESTIDLVAKGWQLYNYPERMTFSATPPDFGSLLIQRRRWSNGGLLILPKLLSYFAKAPKTRQLFKEFFMRFHYLASTTTGCIAALIFMFYPFGDVASTSLLPLSIVPFFLLFGRDLRNSGYKVSDMWRICAFNLMLFPVVVGGVLKQFQQIITGKKIPFGRTPKITGRTAAPAFYCIMEIVMTVAFFAVSVRNIEHEHWLRAAFSLLNGCFMLYALVYYIGVKAALEDITASLKTRWREVFYHAEIIQLPRRWIPTSISAGRKRA